MQVKLQQFSMSPLAWVRSEPEGQITAVLAGLPEMRVTAPTREEALERLRQLVHESLASGHLVPLDEQEANPWHTFAGWAKDDSEYSQFLEEVNKCRRNVDELDIDDQE